MYAGHYAARHPERPAFIMASTGEAVSYRDYEARTNRLAHLLRSEGLQRLDHYAIFMENNARYLESCGAGERSGLYYTCVNSFLTADELAYILNNSESQVLITSRSKAEVAYKALEQCPRVRLCLVTEGPADAVLPAQAGHARVLDFAASVAHPPATPTPAHSPGTPLTHTPGTHRTPTGHFRPLAPHTASTSQPAF